MRKVALQGFPTGTVADRMGWLEDAVRNVASASQDNDTGDIAGAYTIEAAFTEQRDIPASPTLTDLTNVICTLLGDLARGGSNRNQ